MVIIYRPAKDPVKFVEGIVASLTKPGIVLGDGYIKRIQVNTTIPSVRSFIQLYSLQPVLEPSQPVGDVTDPSSSSAFVEVNSDAIEVMMNSLVDNVLTQFDANVEPLLNLLGETEERTLLS